MLNQEARAAECANCVFAEGKTPQPNECPRYDTKLSEC